MPRPDAEIDLRSRSLEIVLYQTPLPRVIVTAIRGGIAHVSMQHLTIWLNKGYIPGPQREDDKENVQFMIHIEVNWTELLLKWGVTVDFLPISAGH